MRNSDVMKYLRLLKIGLHTQADIVTALRGTLYSLSPYCFIIIVYKGVYHRPKLELVCNVGSRLYGYLTDISMTSLP